MNNTIKKEDIKIGLRFYHQGGWWKIISEGVENYYGCVSEKTNAFVTFSTDDFLKITKDQWNRIIK